MECDLIIENATVLTMAGDEKPLENAAVLIENGKIKACGGAEVLSGTGAKARIDAAGRILLPGLVNCHTHMPMSMFRGLADDLPLDVWLNEHIFPAEARQVNPVSVKKWSALSCREMLLGGITTCCDGYFHEDEVVEAVLESGMRAVTGQGVIDYPAPGVPDPGENVENAAAFAKKFKSIDPLLSPSIFCHSPYTCSKETLVAAKNAARDLGVLFQIHAAETKNEINMIQESGSGSVIQYLDSIGILDKDTLLVHAVWVDEEDMEIIYKRGAGVAHCPESNMKLASGIAPVPQMIEMGVPVGLGTDGAASNNDQDLFGEMDTAAKLHKVALMDPCALDARTCLEAATIQGAKAIGLDHLIGSVEPGKQADLILVDTDKPHMTPMYDPYSALVYSAKASDVSLVMVDGNILVENGVV